MQNHHFFCICTVSRKYAYAKYLNYCKVTVALSDLNMQLPYLYSNLWNLNILRAHIIETPCMCKHFYLRMIIIKTDRSKPFARYRFYFISCLLEFSIEFERGHFDCLCKKIRMIIHIQSVLKWCNMDKYSKIIYTVPMCIESRRGKWCQTRFDMNIVIQH